MATYSHDVLDLTPTMTANNEPSPYVASASSEYSVTYPAYGAFNHAASSLWDAGAGVTTGWLKFDFNSALIVRSYSMYATSGYANYHPTNWAFEGSNNNSDWTVLDTRAGISWSDGENKIFTFRNNLAYRYYRINVSASGSTELIINELEMFAGTYTFNDLQSIPHDTTKYSKNPVELINIANRQRIGLIGTTYHNYIGA